MLVFNGCNFYDSTGDEKMQINEHLFEGFIGPRQMNRAGLKRTSSEMLSNCGSRHPAGASLWG